MIAFATALAIGAKIGKNRGGTNLFVNNNLGGTSIHHAQNPDHVCTPTLMLFSFTGKSIYTCVPFPMLLSIKQFPPKISIC
jgi:hypothetical protein